MRLLSLLHLTSSLHPGCCGCDVRQLEDSTGAGGWELSVLTQNSEEHTLNDRVPSYLVVIGILFNINYLVFTDSHLVKLKLRILQNMLCLFGGSFIEDMSV